MYQSLQIPGYLQPLTTTHPDGLIAQANQRLRIKMSLSISTVFFCLMHCINNFYFCGLRSVKTEHFSDLDSYSIVRKKSPVNISLPMSSTVLFLFKADSRTELLITSSFGTLSMTIMILSREK